MNRSVVVLAVVLLCSGATCAAQPSQPFRARLMLTKSDADTQFIRRVFMDLMTALEGRLKQPFDIRIQAGARQYLPVLEKGDFDLVFSDDSNVYLNAREKWKVEPLVMPLMFEGSMPVCLYVKKTGPIRRPADLADKRVMMLGTELYYAILADILGKSPIRVLGRLQTVEVAQSGLLALSLDQVDGALANKVVFRFTETTNPGAVKNLRELACGPIVPIPPYFVKPAVSKQTKEKIIEMLLSANTSPDFPEFRRMAQAANIRLVKTGPALYEPLLNLEKKARKNGYFQDYKIFKKSMQ